MSVCHHFVAQLTLDVLISFYSFRFGLVWCFCRGVFCVCSRFKRKKEEEEKLQKRTENNEVCNVLFVSFRAN